MPGQFAPLGHGDNARFLRNDEHRSIRGFADAQCRPVPCTQVPADASAFRQGQDAGSRHDSSSSNHHSPIMQRGVRLKNVLQQRGRNPSIHGGTGFADVLQACLLLEDNQGTYPAATQIQHALDDFIHNPLTIIPVIIPVLNERPTTDLLKCLP